MTTANFTPPQTCFKSNCSYKLLDFHYNALVLAKASNYEKPDKSSKSMQYSTPLGLGLAVAFSLSRGKGVEMIFQLLKIFNLKFGKKKRNKMRFNS